MTIALLILDVYAVIGVLVAIWFVTRRVGRVDATAAGSGLLFRILILPGAAALWPLVLRMPADGTRASDAPEARRTDTHRVVHRALWPVLMPAVAAVIVIALAFRAEPALPIDGADLPDAPPTAGAEPAP